MIRYRLVFGKRPNSSKHIVFALFDFFTFMFLTHLCPSPGVNSCSNEPSPCDDVLRLSLDKYIRWTGAVARYDSGDEAEVHIYIYTYIYIYIYIYIERERERLPTPSSLGCKMLVLNCGAKLWCKNVFPRNTKSFRKCSYFGGKMGCVRVF